MKTKYRYLLFLLFILLFSYFLSRSYINGLNKSEYSLNKSYKSSAKDFTDKNINIKKALADYQKNQKLASRYEYDKILSLPWGTIDILYQNNKTNEAINYGYNKCNALFMAGKEKDALNALKNIINKFEGKTKDCAFTEILMLKAVIYQRLNYYKLALVSLEKASLFAQKNTKCDEIQVAIETEKSYLFTTLNQHDKSLIAAKKALRISKKREHISGSYAVIGKVYLSLNQPKKALVNILKALKLVDKNDTYRTNYYKCLMIETYFGLKNHKKLDSIFLELKDNYFEYHKYLFYRYKAKSLVFRNKYPEALYFYNKAKQQIPEMHLITERILLKEISDVLQLIGNYKESNKLLIQYLDLESTFTIEEKNNRISEQTVLLELSEKEADFQKSKRKSLEQKLLLYKKNKVISIGFIILATLLLLILTLKYFNKIYKRKNKELEVEKRIVINTNEVLNKTLVENKLLLKEIHHRVKNNLQLVMSLLHLQAHDQNILSIEDFIEKGQARIASMVLIHENLYQNENVGNIDFIEYLDNLIQNIRNSFGDNTSNILINVDVKFAYFDIQTAIPLGLIINELVTNAFKHAFPNQEAGSISVSINKKSDKHYILIIEDNGVGFVTVQNKKKSLGLELVSLLVLQLKGTLSLDQSKGTSYIVNFQTL